MSAAMSPANRADHSVAVTGISPGEKYWARRNGPWRLLTCRRVRPAGEGGWVEPVELAYSFDLHECFKARGAA